MVLVGEWDALGNYADSRAQSLSGPRKRQAGKIDSPWSANVRQEFCSEAVFPLSFARFRLSTRTLCLLCDLLLLSTHLESTSLDKDGWGTYWYDVRTAVGGGGEAVPKKQMK